MTDSKLISATVLSPNFTADRKLNGVQYEVDTITPHCTAGSKDSTCVQVANVFSSKARQASCNYAIGGDGAICLVVHEKDRSWCSGGLTADQMKKLRGNYETGSMNDYHAITVEIASDTSGNTVNAAAIESFIALSIDIMERYGKNRAVFIYTSDNNGEAMVNYKPQPNEMKFTWHRWFAQKACPGKYIMDHMQYIIDKINEHFEKAEQVNEDQTAVTSDTTDAAENSGTSELKYKTGDLVYFIGGSQFGSANASNPAGEVKASLAKITQTYNGKHPYHCRRVNSQGEFIVGGIYGWTDEANLTT